jgi:hypothetical protein
MPIPRVSNANGKAAEPEPLFGEQMISSAISEQFTFLPMSIAAPSNAVVWLLAARTISELMRGFTSGEVRLLDEYYTMV